MVPGTSDGAFTESEYLIVTSNVEHTILCPLLDTVDVCCPPATTVEIIKWLRMACDGFAEDSSVAKSLQKERELYRYFSSA